VPHLVWLSGPHGRPFAEDLVFSLRAAYDYVPDLEVTISGWLPGGIDPDKVNYIYVSSRPGSHASSTANLRAVCENSQVPDEFILMHDDMYLLQALPEHPISHRGSLRGECERRQSVAEGNYYTKMHWQALELLQSLGVQEPLSYELHRPLLVNKANMLATLDLLEEHPPTLKRTVYGNLHDIGGFQEPDVKVFGKDEEWDGFDWVVSSNSVSWEGTLGRHIRVCHPDEAPWEVPLEGKAWKKYNHHVAVRERKMTRGRL
jgi:hypothetical protein